MARHQSVSDKLGGDAALRAAVDLFTGKLLKDPELAPFFEDVNLVKFKLHQFRFMSIAFSELSKGWDIAEFIADKHARLFEKGVNGKHFDIVIGHFVGALQELGVQPDTIDQAVGVLAPLRPIFAEQGGATPETKTPSGWRAFASKLKPRKQ